MTINNLSDINDKLDNLKPAQHYLSLTLLVALVTCLVLTLTPIHHITYDDMWFELWWKQGFKNAIQTAYDLAVAQGRMPRPNVMFFYLPYFFDSTFYFNAVRFTSLLLCVYLTAKILENLTGNYRLSFLFSVLFFAFAENTWAHNLFSSFIFAWHAFFACYLFSLLLLMKALKEQRMSIAIIGAVILVIFGLHELFVPYIFLHIVVWYWLSKPKFRENLKYLAPYIFGVIFWLILWALWRIQHPAEYGGAQVAQISLSRIFKTLYYLTESGVPGVITIRAMTVPELFHQMMAEINSRMEAIWIIKGIIVGILVYYICNQKSVFIWAKNAKISLVGALIIAAFLPNILVALTPQYQKWVVDLGVRAYAYTHFSYFAWTGIVAIGLLSIPYRLNNLRLCVALGCALLSIAIDIHSAPVNADQVASSKKWQTMNAWINSDTFRNTPDNSTIYAPQLPNYRNIAAAENSYWASYIQIIKGKRLNFISKLNSIPSTTTPAFYYLGFSDSDRNGDQNLIYGNVVYDGQVLKAKEVTLIKNSVNRISVISGYLLKTDEDCAQGFFINDQYVENQQGSYFEHLVGNSSTSMPVELYQLKSNCTLDIMTLNMRYSRTVNPLQTLKIQLDSGFLGWEFSGLQRWSWTSNNTVDLLIENTTNQKLAASISFELASLTDRRIKIYDSTGTSLTSVDVDKGLLPSPVSLALEIQPGIHKLKFTTEEPGVTPGNGDPRTLTFMIRNPYIFSQESQ